MYPANLPARVRQQYEKLVRETPRAELGTRLLLFLNASLEQAGIDPIPVRQMVYDLRDVGRPLQVAVPDGEVITGSLEQLTLSGRGRTEVTGSSEATTTTTAVPAAPAPVP